MATEIDKDLVAALKQARGGKAMQFAYVAKSASEGRLLVSKNRIPPKQVAEAKQELGGGTILKGRCQGVDGEIVFEVAKEPPATLLAQLKRRMKEDAGVTWPVVIKVKADAEEEAAEDQGEDAPPPAPPAAPTPAADPATEWKTKLAAMTPAIKAALEAKVPATADIQKLLAQAVSLSKPGGDMPLAVTKLTEAHALAVGPGATPSAPPKAPDVAAILKAKQAEWLPAIKAAILAKGPKAAEVQKLLQESVELAKPGGNLVTALGKLKAANDLAVQNQPPAPVAPKAPVGGDDVTKRFNALGAKLKTALAANGPNVAKLKQLAVAVNGAIKANDFTESTRLLNELERLLVPPTDAGTDQPLPPDGVKMWTTARADAVAKLKVFAKEFADAKHPDSVAAILELNAVIKQLTAAPTTRRQVSELIRYVEQDEVVADVCEMAEDIRTPLLAALTALSA